MLCNSLLPAPNTPVEVAIKRNQLIAANKASANKLLSRMLAELEASETEIKKSQVTYVTIGVKTYA